jgi:hypothetical protein
MLNLFNTLRATRSFSAGISPLSLRFFRASPVQILQTSLLIKRAMELKQAMLYSKFRKCTSEFYNERRRIPLNAGLIQYKHKKLNMIVEDMRLNQMLYKTHAKNPMEAVASSYEVCDKWYKLHVVNCDNDQLLYGSEFEHSYDEDLERYKERTAHFESTMNSLSETTADRSSQRLLKSIGSFISELDYTPIDRVQIHPRKA